MTLSMSCVVIDVKSSASAFGGNESAAKTNAFDVHPSLLLAATSATMQEHRGGPDLPQASKSARLPDREGKGPG